MKKILLILLVVVIAAIAWFGYKIYSSMQGVSADQLEETYMMDDERIVEIAGASVRVKEQGPSDGPVVILLHGFTFSLESFDGWADALSSDYRVIRYDLLGHGLTGPDPQKRYSPMERSAFLGEVMNALGIETATIGGNSLGGLVAWRFAAHNPERVEKLILVDAAAYSINGVTDEPVAVPPAMKAFLLTVPEAGVEQTINIVYGDPSRASAERKQVLGDMMRREGNGQAFIDHLEEFVLPDPTAELAQITAPTLILWGGQDRMIPVAQARQLEEAIADTTLFIYSTLGHAPQEEDPVVTVADVIAFLER